MAALSEASQSTVAISSMCAVFAESEVVSLVARGCPVPDIIRGVHEAIAQRSVALLKRVGIKAPVAMSGGVARNRGVTSCLEKKLGADIKIPPNPQFMGAFGAAIIARSKMLEGAA
jgi:activator of 2-hydroxyglutaryl-CoA dehydratase